MHFTYKMSIKCLNAFFVKCFQAIMQTSGNQIRILGFFSVLSLLINSLKKNLMPRNHVYILLIYAFPLRCSFSAFCRVPCDRR